MKDTDNIPHGDYSGYYWMSDATVPVIFPGHTADKDHRAISRLNELLANPESNPFVIEAQLYDPAADRSFSIKYIDGAYVIKEYTGMKADNKSVDDSFRIVHKRYYANRMPGKELHFLQYWRGQEDALCEGMKVLQPAEMIFVGFEPLDK